MGGCAQRSYEQQIGVGRMTHFSSLHPFRIISAPLSRHILIGQISWRSPFWRVGDVVSNRVISATPTYEHIARVFKEALSQFLTAHIDNESCSSLKSRYKPGRRRRGKDEDVQHSSDSRVTRSKTPGNAG